MVDKLAKESLLGVLTFVIIARSPSEIMIVSARSADIRHVSD